MTDASDTPLETKLGLKDGQRVAWIGLPTELGFLALSRLFARTEMALRARELTAGPFDMVHIFTLSAAVLDSELPMALERLAPGGMLWVSWPDAAAEVPTDMTVEVVRAQGRKAGLTDMDLCAVDDTWSGLRLATGEPQQ
jgi:hypothetical protein